MKGRTGIKSCSAFPLGCVEHSGGLTSLFALAEQSQTTEGEKAAEAEAGGEFGDGGDGVGDDNFALATVAEEVAADVGAACAHARNVEGVICAAGDYSVACLAAGEGEQTVACVGRTAPGAPAATTAPAAVVAPAAPGAKAESRSTLKLAAVAAAQAAQAAGGLGAAAAGAETVASAVAALREAARPAEDFRLLLLLPRRRLRVRSRRAGCPNDLRRRRRRRCGRRRRTRRCRCRSRRRRRGG